MQYTDRLTPLNGAPGDKTYKYETIFIIYVALHVVQSSYIQLRKDHDVYDGFKSTGSNEDKLNGMSKCC